MDEKLEEYVKKQMAYIKKRREKEAEMLIQDRHIIDAVYKEGKK